MSKRKISSSTFLPNLSDDDDDEDSNSGIQPVVNHFKLDESDADSKSESSSEEKGNSAFKRKLFYGKRVHKSSDEDTDKANRFKLSDDSDEDVSVKAAEKRLGSRKIESYKRAKSEMLTLSDEDDEVSRRELSNNKGQFSDISKKLMAKMGYTEGKGLGKYNQGRTEIIQSSKQRGRRGLGIELPSVLEPNDEQWDFDKDIVNCEETVSWLCNTDYPIPTPYELNSWLIEDERKLTIEDEIEFCDQNILQEVLDGKNVFDSMVGDELRKARTRSNPYETIRGAFFLNRAAMKMANMDAVLDFMFTKPLNENGEPSVGEDQLLYFADVCAGPGGFSEYILYRKQWKAKGFGFTLKGANDFKLEDFFAGPSESFEPHYGVRGSEGDGDVFNTDNQLEFREFVLKSTNGEGVHFMMADGGFSVDGQENIQEILSKQLYLCQFLVALSIIRPGGHFVCKIFDLLTPFSVGLVYLMYLCFKQITIFKPVTSRPANSERYIICKWMREDTTSVYEYFNEINKKLPKLWDKNKDISQVVPLEIIKKDTDFYNFIRNSNNTLGQIQILNLRKIQAFYQNQTLHDGRQGDVRKTCLELWKIPDNVRSAPKWQDPSALFRSIRNNEETDYMSSSQTSLTEQVLNKFISIDDYRCVITGGRISNKEDYFFVLSTGKTGVYYCDGCGKMDWKKLPLLLELPKGTFFYAETLFELQGESRGQKKTKVLHIIDVARLGDVNVSHLPYEERMKKADMFAHAVSKPSRPDYAEIRVKKIFEFGRIDDIFQQLENHAVKGRGGYQRLCFPCNENRFYVPLGVMIFRITQDPWMLGFSKSQKKKYFFNNLRRQSTFDQPKDAFASFRSMFSKRFFWNWEDGAESVVTFNDRSSCLHKDKVLSFIKNKAN